MQRQVNVQARAFAALRQRDAVARHGQQTRPPQ